LIENFQVVERQEELLFKGCIQIWEVTTPALESLKAALNKRLVKPGIFAYKL